MVVPASRMSRSRRSTDAVSLSVRPLHTSSQSSRLGRAARQRASSSRFWSPTESVPASAAARPARPTRSSTRAGSAAVALGLWEALEPPPLEPPESPEPERDAPARGCGAPARPKRRPTSTFSSTDRARKGLGTWCVRTTPARAAASDRAPVRSRPWKITAPEVGRSAPATMASSVVLPAPLGPIRPQIAPSSTVKPTSFKAARPAKYRVTRSTRRSAGISLPPAQCAWPLSPADARRAKKRDALASRPMIPAGSNRMIRINSEP